MDVECHGWKKKSAALLDLIGPAVQNDRGKRGISKLGEEVVCEQSIKYSAHWETIGMPYIEQ